MLVKTPDQLRQDCAEYYRCRNLNPNGSFQDPLVSDTVTANCLLLIDEVVELRKRIAVMNAANIEQAHFLTQALTKAKANAQQS